MVITRRFIAAVRRFKVAFFSHLFSGGVLEKKKKKEIISGTLRYYGMRLIVRRTAAKETCQLGNIKCRRCILAVCKLVWEFGDVLCPVDKINDNGTSGRDCTWLELGTVGTAAQY